MLGIRLSDETEALLARHARALGRPKSAIARDWIVERLHRESIDEQMRRAAIAIANHPSERQRLAESEQDVGEWLKWLDEEDGGYDWGPEGPPL
jgi:predicted transcriptional regulator